MAYKKVDPSSGAERLEAMFQRADPIDLEEGLLAYQRYHLVMQKIADRFDLPLSRVVAAFVSLSPNSSYQHNLRSTISVIDGFKRGKTAAQIVVSTYGHCKIRALDYVAGHKDFLKETKGPKIISFYHNVFDPNDGHFVTVDGHMSCIWQGRNMTMREALIPAREYREIRDATRALAFRNYMRPCQMQAILWFVRKRLSNVIYDPQFDLFAGQADVWKTFVDVNLIKPYRSNDDVNSAQSQQAGIGQAGLVDGGGASASEGFGAQWPKSEPPARSR